MKYYSNKFLFILLFFISCVRYEEIPIDPYNQLKFIKEKLPKELTNHFPDVFCVFCDDVDDFGMFRLKEVCITENQPFDGLFLYALFDLKCDLDSMLYNYKTISKAYGNQKSTQFFLIPTRKFGQISQVDIEKNKYVKNKLPIPSLSGVFKYVHKEGSSDYLSSDYQFFLLDASPGKFLPDDNLVQYEYVAYPWKHGFSKGVVINKSTEEAIYWIEVW